MTSKAPAAPKKSELDLRELALSYGLVYDEIQGIPELKALFQKAVANDYSATRFTAELKNSAWWRSTPDDQRKFTDLFYQDPATWNQKMLEAATRANQLAVQVGLGDLAGGQQITNLNAVSWQLRDAAYFMNAHSWSEDRLKDWLGSQVHIEGGYALGGEAGRTYNQLHALAYANGRSYTADWYQTWARQIAGGSQTIERAEQDIRRDAAAEYKAFAQQILAGQNAMDLASPYLRSVSTLLEKPDGSIGLNDPLMRRAMSTTNQDGSAYGVWQLENDVRSDARWKQTDNARESLTKLGHQVLSDFGLTF